jgi:hypothetical protein
MDSEDTDGTPLLVRDGFVKLDKEIEEGLDFKQAGP